MTAGTSPAQVVGAGHGGAHQFRLAGLFVSAPLRGDGTQPDSEYRLHDNREEHIRD